MPVQKIEFEYNIPEGYRFVRYGIPNNGEEYLSIDSSCILKRHGHEFCGDRIVIEKIPEQEQPSQNTKRHKNADLIHAWAEGAIIQFKASNGIWANCLHNEPRWRSDVHYRVKPAVKRIKFRNWLTKSGRISAWNLIEGDSVEDHNEFKCWVGDWQSVEVEEQ